MPVRRLISPSTWQCSGAVAVAATSAALVIFVFATGKASATAAADRPGHAVARSTAVGSVAADESLPPQADASTLKTMGGMSRGVDNLGQFFTCVS